MIGILIIAHGSLGESLMHCACHVMGKTPEQLQSLAVSIHDDPDEVLPRAQAIVAGLNTGDGVLILSDIYGATPCNIVSRLLTPGTVEGVAGINLPMLVRVLNYRQEPLNICIDKAISGGREGVVHFTERGCNHAL
ncbi:MAG TPA: PTS sugar transporter subunit IIA [Methylophilus sp.]